jgi:hypothetical protein
LRRPATWQIRPSLLDPRSRRSEGTLPSLYRAGQVGMGCQRTLPWPWIDPQKALLWGVAKPPSSMPILRILAAKGVRLVKSKLGYRVHPIVLVRSVGMAQASGYRLNNRPRPKKGMQ